MNRVILCLAVSTAFFLCSIEQASAGPLGRLLLGENTHHSSSGYAGRPNYVAPNSQYYGPVSGGNSVSGGNYGPYYRGFFAPIGPFPSLGNYYPQYYGGFHARYFQDIGIPTGDRGIRGSAW